MSADTAPSPPGNVPSVPGTAVLISVIDEQGQPVKEGTIEISVENQVVPQWDFSYALDFSALLPSGLLPLHPPSGRVPATVSIQVVTPTGEASDTLVISGNEFWEAVVATDLDYVAVHEFDLAKSGTTSNVVYTTEPQSYPETQPAVGPGPGQHPITPSGGPQGVIVVDAQVDDGGTPSDPRQERDKLQGAIDSMMADRGISTVDVVAIAANVWTSLPTGEGSAPLAVYLGQDKTEHYYCWDPIGLIIQQYEVPGPCPLYDGMSVRPTPTPAWTPPAPLPRTAAPILHPTGAGDILVQSRACGPWPAPELSVPYFTLYGDGTLIYWVYNEDVPGYLLLHGKLTETAIQQVLHRTVDEARFFDSEDRYVNIIVVDAGATCITVRTTADRHSVYVYALHVYDLVTEVPRDMTPQQLAQVRQLSELDRWLLNIDLRDTGSPDWTDLGVFIPEAISLFVTPDYNSSFGHPVSPWPFLEVNLGAFPRSPIGPTVTVLEGDIAWEVYQFLSATPVFIFSRGDAQAKVAYRPHLPYEDQWRNTD